MQNTASTLLLVTHVAIRRGLRGPKIDDQTAAGIAQWCRYFDRVTYYGIESDVIDGDISSSTWIDIVDSPGCDRCEVIALPRAYRLGKAVKAYKEVRAKLRYAVSTHRHLCFTFGGLVGDWPAVAAREAISQKRPYGAWIDRVEPLIIRHKMASSSLKKRLLWAATLPLIEHNTRYLIRKSSIALLQGLDTFNYYAKYSSNPHCTYDTHTNTFDQIAPYFLAQKQARIMDRSPVSILYVGRAVAMKGPGDWLDTLECLHREGVPFQATWIGDGPELSMMSTRIAGSPIAGKVHLPGFEGDRSSLLRVMRESDILLFCHKTPESPRCLIEALVSGCPLVGYDTAYPRGLVQAKGGAILVPQGNIAELSLQIARLHKDRLSFAQLIAAASASGEAYNEDAVYKHRASLMKLA